MNRVLACDLDGVIFKFNDAYASLFKQFCGYTYPPETKEYPTSWYWEREHPKYDPSHEQKIWQHINGPGNYSFWRFLPAYDGANEFLDNAQSTFNDIYFITARNGKDVKRATEHALETLGVTRPQVIIASDKVPHLIGVGATDFLDDRDKNFNDVLNWGKDGVQLIDKTMPRNLIGEMNNIDLGINLWMLDRPWNRDYKNDRVKRINDPMEIL